MAPPSRRTKIVAHDRARLGRPGRARAADRGRDGRRAAQLLARNARRSRRERAAASGQAQEAAGRPLALIADLQGPKCGSATSTSPWSFGRATTSSSPARTTHATETCRSRPPCSARSSSPGRTCSSPTGSCACAWRRSRAGRARCEVITGGFIEEHKGVNLPGVPLPVPSLTEKDLADLEFALELGVDYVAQSFVRSRADVAALAREARGGRLAGMGDREDRAQGGGRRARRRSSTRPTR